MRATAIIPVKRFAAAKERLADALGEERRAALAAAMLADVLAQAAQAQGLERLIVVSGEPGAEQAARDYGAEIVPDRHDTGQPQAARLGVARALELGAACAALLPGDCPLLDPDELDAALARMSPGRVAIGPDRHGTGTNALLLAPPNAIEPAFGPGSRARHEALAREAGHEAVVEPLASLALDVDTPDDLAALREALSRTADRGRRTAEFLERAGLQRGRHVGSRRSARAAT